MPETYAPDPARASVFVAGERGGFDDALQRRPSLPHVASMMRRRAARLLSQVLAGGAVLAVLASGCAGAPAGNGGAEGEGSTGGSAADDGAAAGGIMPAELPAPSELVGLWRVSADGVPADTWVQIGSRFSRGEVTVWAECGLLHGTWLARAGALLTSIDGWSGDCESADAAAWLTSAVGYGPAGEGIALIDADGIEHAILAIDGEPAARSDIADEFRQQPHLDESQRAALDAVPTPPADVAPASFDAVLGRWLPVGSFATEPFLELAADGTWTGSDGCNGLGGRWALAGDGSVLATSGPQTLMACDGANLGSALVGAAYLVVAGEELVFYGADGAVLAQAAPDAAA